MRSQVYKKVLIAIDAFADYHNILARGLNMAAAIDQVSLIHVTLPEIYFAPYGESVTTEWLSTAREKAFRKLNEIAAAHNIAAEHAYLVGGTPAEEIQELADALDVDLIVMGTHGQRGVRLLLGSTANAVLHGINRDVLIVRV